MPPFFWWKSPEEASPTVTVQQNFIINIEELNSLELNQILDINWILMLLLSNNQSLDYSQKLLGDKNANLEWVNKLSTNLKTPIEQLINISKGYTPSAEVLGGIASNKVLNIDWDSLAVFVSVVQLYKLSIDYLAGLGSTQQVPVDNTRDLLSGKVINPSYTQTTFASLSNPVDYIQLGVNILNRVNLESLLSVSGQNKSDIDYLSGVEKSLTKNIDFIQKLQESLDLNLDWMSNSYIVQDYQLSVDYLSKILDIPQKLNEDWLAGVVETLKLNIDYDGTNVMFQVSPHIWILGNRSKTWILNSVERKWVLSERGKNWTLGHR